MQPQPPAKQVRPAIQGRPSPPPLPPQAVQQAPRPAVQAAPAPHKPRFGIVSKALAVLLLAGFSLALGAAFALPARNKKKAGTPPAAAKSDVVVPTESIADFSSGYQKGGIPQPVSSDDDPPARSAVAPSTFDVPSVKPKLPAGDVYAVSQRIDRNVSSKLAEMKLPASPVSGDAEFIRRAHLDLVGRIPTQARTVAFLDDTDPLKRSKLIDELLASPDFGRHFARIWADMLIKRDFDTNKNLRPQAFIDWMGGHLNKGTGWDKVVTEMIAATGAEAQVPQAFFVLANLDNKQPSPQKLAGTVGNLFMGIQIQCAECHQHPMTAQWGMDDFWGVAAFFGHTRAERAGDAKKMTGPATIRETDAKVVKGGPKKGPAGLAIAIPDPNDPRKTVRTTKGKFFESDKALPTGNGPYRPALAAWLTAKDNKYFAPATVNRVWAHFFARGLVNPIDDMNPANKATHPELLASLADTFRESGHDVKALARAICNSEAYQRTSRPVDGNQNDERWYSRMPVKVMEAKVLLDSLAVVTGQQQKAPKADGGKGAEKSPTGTGGDAIVRFFDTREYDDDVTEYSYGIPQLLRMMNTNLTASSKAVADRVASKHKDDRAKAIEELYLTALSRRPTTRELTRLREYVSKQPEPAKGYAGVLWALLNSAEFVSNH